MLHIDWQVRWLFKTKSKVEQNVMHRCVHVRLPGRINGDTRNDLRWLFHFCRRSLSLKVTGKADLKTTFFGKRQALQIVNKTK
jgi:hypothetical protein